MAFPARRRQPATVRVASLDVQHSHRRSAVVLGPVTMPSLDELRSRFAAMAAVGPVARIGLQPSTASMRWRFTPHGLERAVRAADPAADDDPMVLLAALREMPDGGIRVLAGRDHLAIDFSHGLGEIPLLDLLVAVLLGGVDPSEPALWRPYRHAVAPLPAAAIRAIGLRPRRLLPLWRHHRRTKPAATAAPAAGDLGVGPSPATRIARIAGAEADELRRLRDATRPGVSMFAVYTCALHTAFADNGFDVDPVVTLPFDVRRYLPVGWDTLASFSAGLDFTVDPAAGPGALHSDMGCAVRMARPVANLVASSVKARAARWARHGADWSVPPRPRMRLLHSSIGSVPRTAWSFSDPAEACVLVASDPAGPCGVTVTTATVPGALWMTAEFHESVFDAEQVCAALDSVPERARELLSRTG